MSADTTTMLRRITLRGRWEIKANRGADAGLFVLVWMPAGQWGNPLVRSVVVHGDDLDEIVRTAFEQTEPYRGGLDYTVEHCLRERERRIAENRRVVERERLRRLHEAERENYERWGWAFMRAEGRRLRRIAEARRVLA